MRNERRTLHRTVDGVQKSQSVFLVAFGAIVRIGCGQWRSRQVAYLNGTPIIVCHGGHGVICSMANANGMSVTTNNERNCQM